MTTPGYNDVNSSPVHMPTQQSQPDNSAQMEDAQEALESITRMMTGTKVLQNEPGLVYTLAAQKASPQDAQSIDQFLQSLEAEKRVALARSAGHPILLSQTDQAMLDANGVPYKDVLYTDQTATQNAAKQIEYQTNGVYTAGTNADGSLQTDAQGNIVKTKVHSGSGGGFWNGVTGFFDSVGSGLKTAGSGVLSGLNKGWNVVSTSFGLAGHEAPEAIEDVFTFKNPANDPRIIQQSLDTISDMQAQGYNPSSPWSALAYAASGHAHTDVNSLYDKYGMGKVQDAITYIDNPTDYLKNIYNDPNNWSLDPATGKPVLSPAAQAQLTYLKSSQFSDLAKTINAHTASLGNDLANGLGIDPVHDATLYNATSAATNIVASFVIDPTLIALKGVKAVKLAQVGIDSLADSTGAAKILARKVYNPLGFTANVQRGWQRAIDLGAEFRAATTDADKAAIAAKFRAQLPGLEPLMENFTGGEHVFQGYHATQTEMVNGALRPLALFGHSDGIRSLDEAADFVANKWGMTRLMNGRAATQSGLMPGALSALGYRKLKGITAGMMTARSATRTERAVSEVISRANADPMLAKKLLNDNIIRRMQPTEDDAVHTVTGEVLAERGESATTGLASARRAQNGPFEVTPTGEGAIKQNLRSTGDVLGEHKVFGRFSPTAVAERARQTAIRLSTLLPRNSVIDIHDARSGDIVYKTALTFLNRGEANTFRALWNTADAGQRKVMIHGLIDQLGHAAGLGKSAEGRELMARVKTGTESYSSSGNEVTYNGENVALFENQTRTAWNLPSFREMQTAANRIGLLAPTFNRVASSQTVDQIMSLWKFGALFKPSTVTRNMLEGWLRTLLEGRAGAALKARAIATSKNKELWQLGAGKDDLNLYMQQRGLVDTLTSELKSNLPAELRATKQAQLNEAKRLMQTVANKSIVKHRLAIESGDQDLAKQIENSTMLGGQILGRSVAMEHIANFAPLATVGRAYRYLVGKHMDEDTLNALLTYGSDELQSAMEGYGLQLMEYELGWRNAAKHATDQADAGFGPSRLVFNVKRVQGETKARRAGEADTESGEVTGSAWTHQAIDGTTGAGRYARALAQRVNSMPQTASAAVRFLQLGEDAEPAARAELFREVMAGLDQESRNTAFGKVFFEDPESNVARKAINDEEVEAGKHDWANKVVQEYKYMLTGRNGKFQHELGQYILDNGKAPDDEWLAGHLTNDNRPDTMLAPESMAMVPGGPSKLAETLQDLEGAAYQWLVERPLQRLTSAPVYLANYAIARKGLNPMVEKMVAGGMSREAAENLAKDLATRNAWVKTEQLIDDPGQKTQFDIIARNFFPFARATQAMIRRWGTGLWQNPAAARQLMLGYEGAVHSGLIYTNAYGEPTFTYPASGVFNEALRGLSQVPGFPNIAAFPIAGDMTGQVFMSVPGADNPFRMSMGPMAAVPMRVVYTTLLPYLHAHLGLNTAGTQEGLFKMDQLINGPIGAGETWVQFVPTAVRKFYTALDGSQRNSALASAMQGAIATLAAAGLLPPPNASAAVRQQFYDRLREQVKSQLLIRAVFGIFAPAAPSTPSEGTFASGADYAWSLEGAKSLKDEYIKILNDTGGDVGRANVIFATLHPDEVVYDANGDLKANRPVASAYETSGSKSIAPGSYLPSTDATLSWLDKNQDFVTKYKNVAAYFLPEQDSGEPFSDAAYKAQIEFGLRQRKTPSEFLRDIYIKHAESVFYPADHQINAEIDQARLAGNTDQVRQLTELRHNWQQEFYSLNPYFHNKIEGYGDARNAALDQLSSLQQMVKDGDTPDGLGQQIGVMVKAYANYQDFLNAHQGTDKVNKAAKQQALATMNQWAEETFTGPSADIWNGVFRVLNSNFDRLTNGVTG